jgi:putative phosphoesterase
MTITLGVIGDTHLPDRVRQLHPLVLPAFKQANVGAILHAGDISTIKVLAQLDEIAPVYAVRGNRDWIALRHLPKKLLLDFSGVEIGLIHGHGGLRHYLLKRFEYMFRGNRLEMFLPNVRAAFPQARVIVFGHTHRPLQLWVDGQFIFNPGSPHCPEGKNTPPSVGLLHINSGGQVESELVWLA